VNKGAGAVNCQSQTFFGQYRHHVLHKEIPVFPRDLHRRIVAIPDGGPHVKRSDQKLSRCHAVAFHYRTTPQLRHACGLRIREDVLPAGYPAAAFFDQLNGLPIIWIQNNPGCGQTRYFVRCRESENRARAARQTSVWDRPGCSCIRSRNDFESSAKYGSNPVAVWKTILIAATSLSSCSMRSSIIRFAFVKKAPRPISKSILKPFLFKKSRHTPARQFRFFGTEWNRLKVCGRFKC